jgi:hypothetical protein
MSAGRVSGAWRKPWLTTICATVGMKAEWTVDDRALWDRLAKTAAWQQQWAYGAAIEAIGGRVLRCAVRDGRRVVALAQFTARSLGPFAHGALCARGPAILGPDAPRAEVHRLIRATVPLPRPRLVILSPEAGEEPWLSAAGLRQVMTGAAAAVLDLRGDEAALRAAMDQKWRNRLSAAGRAGALRLTLDEGPAPERVAALAAREAAEERAKGYRGLPGALAAAWGRLAGRRAVLLATAEEKGREVAQMLFVRHGAGALYHAGWSDAAGREGGAHPLLLWRAMLALKAQGVARLDLGTIDTRRAPGIARFKLGAGARVEVLAGSWT